MGDSRSTRTHKSLGKIVKASKMIDNRKPSKKTVEEVPKAVAPEIREALEQAKREGYELGVREGLQAGQNEVQSRISRLDNLLHDLSTPLDKLDEQVEEEILQLVIGLTSQLLQREINLTPEQLIEVIHNARDALPVVNQKIIISLHPQDAILVDQYLASQETSEHWQITEDDSITPGGCRVATEHSEVDASIESRIQAAFQQIIGHSK